MRRGSHLQVNKAVAQNQTSQQPDLGLPTPQI